MAPYLGLVKPKLCLITNSSDTSLINHMHVKFLEMKKKMFWYKKFSAYMFLKCICVLFFIILGGGGSGGSIPYDTQTVHESEKVEMECVSTGMI